MPAGYTLDNTVTLKVDGRAFSCRASRAKGRCGHKEFLIEGELYTCAKCGAFFPAAANIKSLLPPRNDWETPGGTAMRPEPNGLWTTLHEEYRFNIDVAASSANRKCELFLDGSEGHDALKGNWFDDFSLVAEETRAWCNPPYQPKGVIGVWLEKAIEQAALGVFSVFLIPMSTSVAWFNDLVVPYAEWHSFKGRIPFDDPLANAGGNDGEDGDGARTSPKQDNLLVIYDPLSNIVGHNAVRDAKTGKRLWTRPNLERNPQ